MTNCPTWEELNALIDGELSAERELQFRWHLDLCSACALHAAGVVTLKRAVGRLHERNVPSPALRRHVMGRVPI
jgi:anti-sigma factor RsiW